MSNNKESEFNFRLGKKQIYHCQFPFDTTNEINGTIYDVDENGDVSLEVGVYKNGKPTFI